MKKLAIFGARGYLGRQLAHYFSDKGVPCDGFDVPECDVTDRAFWETFSPADYSAVLFFAGLTGTERGFDLADSYLQVNEGGLLNLLSRLAPFGAAAPKVVFPSTRLVYRGSEHPLCEDAPKETKTVYAVNKLACESYLSAYANRYGIRYAVCRICVPYGSLTDAGDYSYGTVGFFVRQIADGQPVRLYGGGVVRRTFTHVADICRVVEFLSRSTATGVFNVGGCAHSLREVAERFAAKGNAGVQSVEWPDEALRLESGSTVFDSTRLDELYRQSCGECMGYEDIMK